MSNIELPRLFVNLISEYSGIFTKPSYKHFIKVVSGLILGKQKKSITPIIIIHGIVKTFYNIHRFLNSYKWDSKRLSLRTLEIIIKVMNIERLFLALDDTLVMKYGKCIFGRAIHCNHAHKANIPKYITGWSLV